MSENYPWYGLVTTISLEQGDLIRNCPLLHARTPEESGDVDEADVVLLSHSCDLANDKLRIVQVGPVWSLERMAGESDFFRGRKGREELRRGNVPGYHLLNRCTIEGYETEFLVVDFRSMFGIPLEQIIDLAKTQCPRIRLLPPYREHLAQAFARFFMRVGLPVDIPPF